MASVRGAGLVIRSRRAVSGHRRGCSGTGTAAALAAEIAVLHDAPEGTVLVTRAPDAAYATSQRRAPRTLRHWAEQRTQVCTVSICLLRCTSRCASRCARCCSTRAGAVPILAQSLAPDYASRAPTLAKHSALGHAAAAPTSSVAQAAAFLQPTT
eukprot:IDg21457t1